MKSMKLVYVLAEETMAMLAACWVIMPKWIPNCVGGVAIRFPAAKMQLSTGAPAAFGLTFRPKLLSAAHAFPKL